MTTPKTFTQYFQLQALKDRLPFNIDFEMTQIESEVTETVAGMEFKILNDLVSRESWFLNSVETLNQDSNQQATVTLRILATKVQKILGIEDLSEAINVLWYGDEKYSSDPRYVDFHIENEKEIRNLLELYQVSQDPTAMNWMRVTFFILSRVTSDWSLSKTVTLTQSQIEEIITLISKEANGGVLPEPEAIEDDSVIEDEGKSSKG